MRLKWICTGVTWKVTNTDNDKETYIDPNLWGDELFNQLCLRLG